MIILGTNTIMVNVMDIVQKIAHNTCRTRKNNTDRGLIFIPGLILYLSHWSKAAYIPGFAPSPSHGQLGRHANLCHPGGYRYVMNLSMQCFSDDMECYSSVKKPRTGSFFSVSK